MGTQSAAEAAKETFVPPVAAEVISAEDFKTSFRNHPAGVGIVTADAGAGPVAMTVTSVASVSVAPPLLVFSASDFSSSTPTIRAAETVVVHLLSAGQVELAKLASTSGVNRFREGEWERLPTGEPVYPGAATWIRGRIVDRMDAGTSTVFVVEGIESSGCAPDSDGEAAQLPLVYHNRTWFALDEGSKL